MKAETKTGFKYGLVLGVAIGGLIGFFIAHFWTWLFVGSAITVWFMVWRFRRPKLAQIPPRAVGQ